MSDTPETDAVFSMEGNWDTRALRMNALAQKLERERDKRELTALIYCKNSGYHREMREKAERERDIVDERRASAERESIERLSMCVKYKQERDEARDVALRYRSLYFAQNGIDVNEYQIPWEEAK